MGGLSGYAGPQFILNVYILFSYGVYKNKRGDQRHDPYIYKKNTSFGLSRKPRYTLGQAQSLTMEKKIFTAQNVFFKNIL